jgi:hypothetical protein
MANDTTSNSTPSAPSQPVDEFPGFPGLKLGDVIPGTGGTRVGDPFIDSSGNQWNWKTGSWDYVNLANPPSRDKGGLKPGDETTAPDYYNPASQQSTFVPGTSPSVTKREDQAIVTSGGSTLIQAPSRTPVVPLPPLPQETIQDLARPPIVPQKPNVSIFPKYTQPALVEPTTVPIPARRADVLGSPYMGYVNYDPDEILAAAMKVMRGRSAGRSMMY